MAVRESVKLKLKRSSRTAYVMVFLIPIFSIICPYRSVSSSHHRKAVGAWFLFLPPYSPDLNPIEMAFAKLKALIRRVAARTYDDLWPAVGHVCDLFTEEECFNFFKAAGY
jgi:transposase